jgi:thiamine-phosphate diphosphorylase
MVIAGPPHVQVPDLAASCRAAVEGGATAVQVRVKDLPAADVLVAVRAVVAAVPVPVFVNDRADVAVAAGAFGVHVGQDDVPVAAIRQLAGPRLCVGISAGTVDEAEVARTTDADYWSIGAVFGTGTKHDAGAPIGVDGFAALCARAPADVPVMAIGGITAERIAGVVEAGAVGVAVSAAVFGAPDVVAAAATVRAALDRALER